VRERSSTIVRAWGFTVAYVRRSQLQCLPVVSMCQAVVAVLDDYRGRHGCACSHKAHAVPRWKGRANSADRRTFDVPADDTV